MDQRLHLAGRLAPLALLAPALATAPSHDDPQPASNAVDARDTFASPVVIDAGTAPLGGTRMYPSPVFHDVNGDGLADLVIGDLPGKLTVAHRLPGDGPPRFGPEASMKDREGEDIDFNNW